MKKNLQYLLIIFTTSLMTITPLHSSPPDKGGSISGAPKPDYPNKPPEEQGATSLQTIRSPKERSEMRKQGFWGSKINQLRTHTGKEYEASKEDRVWRPSQMSKQFIKSWTGGSGPKLFKIGKWGNLSSKTETIDKRKQEIDEIKKSIPLRTITNQDGTTSPVYILDAKTKEKLEKYKTELEGMTTSFRSPSGALRKLSGGDAEAIQNVSNEITSILNNLEANNNEHTPEPIKTPVQIKKEKEKLEKKIKEETIKEDNKRTEAEAKIKDAGLNKSIKELDKKIEKFEKEAASLQKKIAKAPAKDKNSLQKQLENLNQDINNLKEDNNKLKLQKTKIYEKTGFFAQEKLVDDLEQKMKELEAPEKLVKALESYKNLASGAEWSQKRKVLTFLGLIIGGGVGSGVFTMLGGFGTEIDIDEGPESFDEGTREVGGEQFGDVAEIDQQFAEKGGYLKMGDFSGASVKAAGEAVPLEDAGPREPTAEEVAQGQVDAINEEEAFGRALNASEQKELFDLFAQIHRQTESLKQLTDNIDTLSKQEKVKIAQRREEIRKLKFDVYYKELIIRYNHDDGTLIRLKEYAQAIDLLDQQLRQLAPQLSSLQQKQEVLSNALTTQENLTEEMSEQIKLGIAKLDQQINQISDTMRNIANERLYLQLGEKVYRGEIKDQDMYNQLSSDGTFIRNPNEPYSSSKNRRLASDIKDASSIPEELS